MLRSMFAVCLLVIFVFNTSGSGAEKRHAVYVASVSWHTAIIVPGYSLPDSIWPDQLNFSEYDYLEIGWGDRDFYQHSGFNLWYAIKAVLWPTRTALHILPLPRENIEMNYDAEKFVKLMLTQKELDNLSVFLISQLELNAQGKVVLLNEGLYYHSRFIAGRSKYFFPKNSNVWAAKALKKAGFRFTPVFYQTTGMVIRRARRLSLILPEDH